MKTRYKVALGLLSLGMIGAAGQVAEAPAEAASPIDFMVDCDDAFWAVTCGLDVDAPRFMRANLETVEDEVRTRIDNDMVCTVETDTLRICHT